MIIKVGANGSTIVALGWKGSLGGFNAVGNATNIVVLGLVGLNGSPKVPFATNEKGWPMVVVVVRDANGFEASVVVVEGLSS